MTGLPQELEVWYVIPAIRRELAIALIDNGINQTQTAKLLGLTKAAVSQYVHRKRASDIDIGYALRKKVKASARRIAKTPDKIVLLNEIQQLCKAFRDSRLLCRLHHKHSGMLPKDCCACFGK